MWGKMVIFSRDRLTKKATSEQRPKIGEEVHCPAISGDEAPQAKESEHNGLGLKLGRCVRSRVGQAENYRLWVQRKNGAQVTEHL